MKRRKKGKRRVITIILLVLIISGISFWGIQTYREYQYPLKYEDHIYRYSETYGVDPYLVMGIIRAESNFVHDAQSHVEAKGLMQLMDETAEEVAGKIGLSNFTVDQLSNPQVNIQLGVWYLSYLLKQFDNDKTLALAAYNAGIGRVNQWLGDPELSSDGKTLDRIPYEETERYVDKVLKYADAYKEIYEA